ncbi:MAP6 domain-containing protein 1, partial [Ornithorhynchus anatinus]
MAWPCISRVCCLARFWNQLDKSDLSVPLTLHNYSDIEGPAEGGPAEGGPARRPDPAAAAPGRSRRGRGSPAAPDPPFAAETQYRRDFGGWTPLPHSAPPGAARDCRRLGLPAAAHAHAPPPP